MAAKQPEITWKTQCSTAAERLDGLECFLRGIRLGIGQRETVLDRFIRDIEDARMLLDNIGSGAIKPE